MKKHSLQLALICSAVLAAAFCAPASAQLVTENKGEVCAVLTDDTGTRIEITNIGIAPRIVCHGEETICQEAFTVCANGKFEIGAERFLGDPNPDFAYNLLPFVPFDDPLNPNNPILDPKANRFNLCRPFIQISTPQGVRTLFLQPEDPTASPLVYDLDDQALDLNGDGDTTDEGEDQVPLGTLVQVIMDNKPDPESGKCLGVRTAFQHRTGTCKLWKVRKFYNTCSSTVVLTQIKEFELPCRCGIFAGSSVPGGSLTAVASIRSTGQYITLQSMGNTGANGAKAQKPYQASAAGSVQADGHFFNDDETGEFQTCRIVPPPADATDPLAFFTSKPVHSCDRPTVPDLSPPFTGFEPRFLEVLLAYMPGGVPLKPAGKSGSEKFVTFCIDVE
jgi:hypothetical protein